ncbi:MAG: hypothetical protein ACI9R3_004759 [Verrucomicrobiales bacterium]
MSLSMPVRVRGAKGERRLVGSDASRMAKIVDRALHAAIESGDSKSSEHAAAYVAK